MTTPLIGFNHEGNQITMLDTVVINIMDEIFEMIDIEQHGNLKIDQLLFVFMGIFQCNDDQIELNNLPTNKQINSMKFHIEYINKKFHKFINDMKCFNGRVINLFSLLARLC